MSLTGLAFLGAFLGGLVLALARHPLFGLYTYVAVFYLHPPSRWWANDLPDLRWALLAAAVTLIATLRMPQDTSPLKWHASTPAKLLIVFLCWIWVQNLWALNPDQHLELSILYTKYIVLFFLIVRLVDTPDKVSHFIFAHVLGCFYLGWLAYTSGASGRLEGVGGPGIDEANALGMHLGTAVVMGAMLILIYTDWRRWVTIAAMPFILNGIVLTGSRSAFLGLIVGAMVLWLLKPESHKKLFLTFGALGLVLAGSMAHGIFWERMQSIKVAATDVEQADTSAQSRIVLIEAQWQMSKGYPHGTGHRGTATLSPLYLEDRWLTGSGSSRARSSHSTPMTVLVEQGWPGVVLFLGLTMWWTRVLIQFRQLRTRSDETAAVAHAGGLLAAMAVVFVSGIFVDYLKVEISIWCMALIAASLARRVKDPARISELAKTGPLAKSAGRPGSPRAARMG